MRWEYETAAVIEPVAGWLTHRSADGWEFCGTYANDTQFIFKRPLPPADALTPEQIADNEARLLAKERGK